MVFGAVLVGRSGPCFGLQVHCMCNLGACVELDCTIDERAVNAED